MDCIHGGNFSVTTYYFNANRFNRFRFGLHLI